MGRLGGIRLGLAVWAMCWIAGVTLAGPPTRSSPTALGPETMGRLPLIVGSAPLLLGPPLGLGHATITVIVQADGWQGAWGGQATTALHLAGLALTPRYLLIQDASGTRIEPLDAGPGTTWGQFMRWVAEIMRDGSTDPSLKTLLTSWFDQFRTALSMRDHRPGRPPPPWRGWLRQLGRRVLRDLLLAWWMAGLALHLLIPSRLVAGAHALRRFPARAFGWGSLLALVLLALIGLLVHSVVGLALLPVVGAAIGLLLMPAGLMIGASGLAAALSRVEPQAFSLPLVLLTGGSLLAIWALPLVGGVFTGLLTLAGLGGLIRTGLTGPSENAPTEGGT